MHKLRTSKKLQALCAIALLGLYAWPLTLITLFWNSFLLNRISHHGIMEQSLIYLLYGICVFTSWVSVMSAPIVTLLLPISLGKMLYNKVFGRPVIVQRTNLA